MIEIVYDRMRLRLTADGHAGFAETGDQIDGGVIRRRPPCDAVDREKTAD